MLLSMEMSLLSLFLKLLSFNSKTGFFRLEKILDKAIQCSVLLQWCLTCCLRLCVDLPDLSLWPEWQYVVSPDTRSAPASWGSQWAGESSASLLLTMSAVRAVCQALFDRQRVRVSSGQPGPALQQLSWLLSWEGAAQAHPRTQQLLLWGFKVLIMKDD